MRLEDGSVVPPYTPYEEYLGYPDVEPGQNPRAMWTGDDEENEGKDEATEDDNN